MAVFEFVVTALGVPVVQRFVVGAVLVVCPWAVPQDPLTGVGVGVVDDPGVTIFDTRERSE
jgi:hypothetical protein